MQKESIKYFIDAQVHTRGCNLKCDYCYLAQEEVHNDIGVNALRYPLEDVLQALSKERLGGRCRISLIGDGETLLPNDIEDLIKGLLSAGHYVSVITNGTITEKVERIIDWAVKEQKEGDLQFKFSLHYLELKRLGLLEQFAETVNYVKKNNVEVKVLLTVGGSYVAVIDEIKAYCDSVLKIKPDVGIARDEQPDGTVKVLTGEFTEEEYYNAVLAFDGDVFKHTWENFNQRRTGFCYAGSWVFRLDLTTGLCRQCLGNDANKFNLYECADIEQALMPVGNRCKVPYCYCGWVEIYNLMPKEYNFYCGNMDLSITNEQLTEDEKEKDNQKNIFMEQIRANNRYVDRCFYEKDYKTGLELAEKILANDLDPSNYWVASLVVKYGYILLEVGEVEKALDLAGCYEELHYLADYCMMMGCIYLKCGMIQEAARMFEEATEKYATYEEGTNTWLPLYNLGVIYECLGKTEDAKLYYQKCGNYEKAKMRLAELK